MFGIIWYRRRIVDFYLRWTALLITISISLRVSMSSIAGFFYNKYSEGEHSDESLILLQIKLQVVEFSLPYYFYLMVTVSLIFSALSFYEDLRDLLFP